MAASTLGLVSCEMSQLLGWEADWDDAWSPIFLLTLSGLVTVMVSMVTCGAPILATAGNLKQEKYHQLLLQRHLPKT